MKVLQSVLDESAPISHPFVSAGHQIYLVGGIVRDLQLGVTDIDRLDFDLTTTALPDETKRLLESVVDDLWTQGERFGTIGCRLGGRTFEITTHRAESYDRDSRKPEVLFGDSIDVDLSRRDFTINAMAIRVPDGSIFDPHGGLLALEEGVLVTPIDPVVSFGDDPLRILRAARFLARYQFSMDVAVASAARELSDRLQIVSVERIRDELDRLLEAERPGPGVRFLADCGAFAWVLPGCDDRQIEGLITALDASPIEQTIRRAILFSFVADPADQLRRLKYSTADRVLIEGFLERLDDLGGSDPVRDGQVRRTVQRLGLDQTDVFVQFLTVHDPSRAEAFAVRLGELNSSEDLSDLEPMLSGGDIIAQLDLEPGPRVGELVKALRLRRLDVGPSSRNDELAYVKDLIAETSAADLAGSQDE